MSANGLCLPFLAADGHVVRPSCPAGSRLIPAPVEHRALPQSGRRCVPQRDRVRKVSYSGRSGRCTSSFFMMPSWPARCSGALMHLLDLAGISGLWPTSAPACSSPLLMLAIAKVIGHGHRGFAHAHVLRARGSVSILRCMRTGLRQSPVNVITSCAQADWRILMPQD